MEAFLDVRSKGSRGPSPMVASASAEDRAGTTDAHTLVVSAHGV